MFEKTHGRILLELVVGRLDFTIRKQWLWFPIVQNTRYSRCLNWFCFSFDVFDVEKGEGGDW